jgi:predicted HTH domain antitoxin
MDITIQIPDELANRFGADVPRRALEALALEEFKSGHLSLAELRRMLGFRTRHQLDGFLKSHGVWADYTVDDFRLDIETLQRLGL